MVTESAKGNLPMLEILEDQQVSIADLHDVPITQASGNVYVITDEDIRHSGATDIPTLLRRIPGMDVIQMTGADFDVSVRGDNQPRANKLLVLLDGRTIYLDSQGEVFWKAIPVTLPEIKRIEVLKGPASAIYGFNAFDGVINIITKSSKEMKGVTLQFGGGEFGTISSAGVYAGNYEKLGYRLSVGRDQNNEWRNRNHVAFRAHKFNAQTTYDLPGQSKLLLSGGLVDVNSYDGPFVDTVNLSQKPALGYSNLSYERPNFFVRTWWSQADQPSFVGTNPSISRFFLIRDRMGTSRLDQLANSYNIETQHGLEFGRANRLTYGVNYRHNTIQSNFLDQTVQEDRLGFYLQEEWRAADTLTAVAGARYDLHNEINPTISPRLALLYSPVTDHTLRLAFSVAYRPPTPFETHTDSRGQIFALGCPPTCGVVANSRLAGSRNLDPERIVSYDVGYQGWYFRHRLRVRTDIFFNHISDLVIQRSASSTLVTFVNGNSTDIYGLEAGLEFLATSWLSGFANYSFQEIGSVSHNVTDFDSRGGPRFKANTGLRGEWENGLSGEAALYYVGAATYPVNLFFFTAQGFTGGAAPPNPRIGSYLLLNLRGAYKFWHERAEVAVTAFNALNDRHREYPTGDTIGSMVMGWLTIKY